MRFNFFKWWKETMTINENDVLELYIGPKEKTIPENDSMKSYVIPKKKKIKCAVVIGHKRSSQGAYNHRYNIHEFEFNEHLAIDIENKIKKNNSISLFRIYRRTYATLPNDLNDLNPDFIISLHCNAFNKSATGTEVLYYHKSNKGKQFASILNSHLVGALGLHDRGIRPKSAEDRGGYLLKTVKAPCLIAEPFFIDNDDDYKLAGIDKYIKLVDAYCHAIEEISTII